MSPNLFATIVAVAILLALGATAALAVVVANSRDQRRLQRRVADTGAVVPDELVDGRSLLHGIARQGRAIEQMVDPKGESQRLLVQAGWRSTQSRIGYYVVQALTPVVVAALLTAFALFGHSTLLHGTAGLAVIGIAGVASLLLPRVALRKLAAARRKRLQNEVPLFIHLLVLLFDSGLSTRLALSSLVKEGVDVLPELQKEVDLLIRQLEAGAEVPTVLRSLEESLAIDDLSSVLGVLRQVDRYGGDVREPLLDTLKVIEERHGLDLREKVNIISGRMTVVMVLFFFPALLILTAGPAFSAILKALGSK